MRLFSLGVVCPSCITLSEEALFSMVKCTLEEFFFLDVNVVALVTTTFNPWINKCVLHIFTLIINFLTLDWESNTQELIFLKKRNYGN